MRREELRDQVAVAGLDIDAIVACLGGETGCRHIGVLKPVQLCIADERVVIRYAHGPVQQAIVVRDDRRRPVDWPAVAPRMGKL